MTEPEDHPTDISATSARQGLWDRPVLWVLSASTAFAVAALAGAWFVQSGNLAAVQDNERPSAAVVAHYAAPAPTPSGSPAPAHG